MRGVGCCPGSAPNHPRLRVRRRWGVVKDRRMVRVSGVSPPVDLRAFNNNIDTLERAVKERVFYVKKDGMFQEPPPVDSHIFHERLSATRELLSKFLPLSAPLTRLQFVETFRGRKRKIYDAAYTSLLGKSFVAGDAEIKVFVKYEKTDFTRKTDPVPRVICPRSPRYNIEVGRYLRPIEERIYGALANLFGHPTVFKGVNAATSGRLLRAKWNMFRCPVAVGLDASRWDQHVRRPALSWEHSVYLSCFPRGKHRRALRRLLEYQMFNSCRGYTADGSVKYTTDGGRMSGDINTSLGNCLLACAMVYAYALSCGVKIQLANNGDDCVVIMEADDLARFSDGLYEWFVVMGFSMQIEEPVYDFEAIEFCQTHPVYVGPDHDSYIMVRHPKYAIAKDTLCVHGWQSVGMFKGWMHAVGTGGLAMTGQVPVFQDFYRMYLQYGKFCKTAQDLQSWGVRQLSRGMVRQYGAVSPLTRASFYWAFGVTPDEQLVLEEFYSGVVLGENLLGEVEFQPVMPL